MPTEINSLAFDEKQEITHLGRYLAEVGVILPRFALILLLLALAGGIVALPSQAQTITETEEGVPARSQNPEEMSLLELFVHSYELGQTRNPYLEWTLRAGGRANIFPSLLRHEESTGLTLVRMEVTTEFDIGIDRVAEILAGYSRGVWGSAGENPAFIGGSLSVQVYTNYEAFIESCGFHAAACFSPGEGILTEVFYHYTEPRSLAAIPHEAGHSNFESLSLWPLNDSMALNNINLNTRPNNYLLLASGDNSEIGGLEYNKLNEAVAELHSHVVYHTLNMPIEANVYGTPIDSLYSAQVYLQLVDVLAADPIKTATIDEFLSNNERSGAKIYELFNYLGSLILEIDPNYSQAILSEVSANPQASLERSFFTFALSQGSTIEIISQLPNETQAGLLLLAELSSAARRGDRSGIFIIPPNNGTENIYPIQTTLDEVGRQQISAEHESAFMTNYRWGSASESVGQESVNRIMAEFMTTGNVYTHEIDIETTILVIFEQLAPQLVGYFSDNLQLKFESAVRATYITPANEFRAMVPENWPLPFTTRAVIEDHAVAGQITSVRYNTVYYNESELTVKNGLWGLIRSALDAQSQASYDYIAPFRLATLEGYDINQIQLDRHYHNVFSIFELYDDPNVGTFTLGDITHLSDLSAWLLLESFIEYQDPVLSLNFPTRDSIETGSIDPIIPLTHPLHNVLEVLHNNPEKRRSLFTNSTGEVYILAELSMLTSGEEFNPYFFDENYITNIQTTLELLAAMPSIENMEFRYTELRYFTVENVETLKADPLFFLLLFGDSTGNGLDLTVYPIDPRGYE